MPLTDRDTVSPFAEVLPEDLEVQEEVVTLTYFDERGRRVQVVWDVVAREVE